MSSDIAQIHALQQRTAKLEQQVGKLERTVEFLLQQLKLDYVDKPDYGDNAPYIALLLQNKKLDAIKLYRENMKTGLAEAQQFIENLKF